MRSLGCRIAGSVNRFFPEQRFLSKFTSVLSVDILVKASGFLLIPIYLRLMTQNEFGLYNYLLSIIQTFSLVLNLGLYIPQTRLYHTLPTQKQKGQLLFTIIATLLFFILVFALLVIFFHLDFWFIGMLFKDISSYQPYRLFVLVALPVSVLSFMLTNFFYTSEKIKEVKSYNVCRIVFINFAALASIYFIHRDSVGVRLEFTYAAELILLLPFGYFFLNELVPSFNWSLMKTSFKMGFPIMASAIFGIVINFSDKFFLEKYGTLKDLSNYYLAFSFASILPLIFTSLQNVWLPGFMKESDIKENIRKTKKLVRGLLLIFLGLSVSIWVLFKGLMMVKIIPQQYNQVLFILPLLLIIQIVMSLSALFSNYLVYFEKTEFVLYAGLIVSAISLTMGLWLIPRFGVYGAAISSLTSNCAYFLIYYFLAGLLKEKHLKKLAVPEIETYEYTTI
jgi:O-antigen/teichoic acid export membrane protein